MKDFWLKNKILILIAVIGFLSGIIFYFFQNQKEARQDLFKKETASGEPFQESSRPETGGQLPKEEEKAVAAADCAPYPEAGKFVGKEKCIAGKIDNVYVSAKGTIFLNFCPDYKNCSFSAVIFSSDSAKFPEADKYRGKSVEITGFIKTYQGRPEIVVNDEKQIRVK